MSERFLHLLQDSSYSNWIVEHIETVAPSQNDFIVFSSSGMVSNFNPSEKIKIIRYPSFKINTSKYEKIIVQYLDDNAAYFLLRNLAPKEFDKVTWVLWGGDFYFIPGDEKKIYNQFSWNYLYKKKWVAKKFYHFIINRYRYYTNKPSLIHKLKVLKMIPTCAAGVHQDVVYIEKRFKKKFELVKDYRFLPLQLMFTEKYEDYKSIGNKIILGNSADPANNHYEAILLLEKLNITFSVVCPLTYGSQPYKQLIMETGERILGDKFEPLTKKMSKDDYYKKLTEVGFAVYNHHIQMGVGNLIGLLWLGVKIFMNSDSPLYKEFKNLGLIVFSIDSEMTNQALRIHLDEFSICSNRSIILKNYSKEYVLSLHKKLLDLQ